MPEHEDTKDVGQDRTHTEVTKKYDAGYGQYQDNVQAMPQDDKLPIRELPQAPDPSPFKIGPLAGDGGRNGDGG